MKIGEIIQRVQSAYSKGVQSDDSRLMNRHIYNKLLTVRARLISQDARKKQRISQWNYQVIPCVELIKVPDHECPCIPLAGCEILRSRYKLPKPISGLSGTLIQSVTSIDRSKKISEISINAISAQKGNKYAFKTIDYFIENEYLYISTPKSAIGVVRVVGLFEDPIETKKFKSFCGECKECEDCVDYQEEEFPIDNDSIDAMVELALNELVILFGQSVQDNRNNTNDDVTQNR